MSTFDIFNFVLPVAFGALGFLVMEISKRVVRAAHVKEQHRRANDRLVLLIHDLVRLKNEVLLTEVEIQEVMETLPIDKARWAVEMKQLADTVPPMVLAQIKRFGLYEPPAEIEYEEQEEVVFAMSRNVDKPSAPVVQLDAWGRRDVV